MLKRGNRKSLRNTGLDLCMVLGKEEAEIVYSATTLSIVFSPVEIRIMYLPYIGLKNEMQLKTVLVM